MCQAKSKGGKRCFAHMMGTQASVMMASIMGNVPEKHAAEVSRELRKEGKGLPTPTEEEILAFARNNQFIARHDITIPENMRPGLVKRWQKAEAERPDGGGFHSWKHVLVESVVRYRRTVAAVGLAGLMTFSTACSGGQEPGNAPENLTSPSPSISQTAPAGPSITAGEVVKTDKGEYLRSTIKEDDPAMQYDESVVEPGTLAAVPREALESAHKYNVSFIAEEVIDSPLNNGAVSVDSWWEENQNRFHPGVRDSIRADFEDRDGPVIRGLWQKDVKEFDYNYVYSPQETRFSDRKIDVTNMYYTDKGVYVVETDFSFDAKVQTPTGLGTEKTSGTYKIGLIPDEQDKEWKISYYKLSYEVKDFSAPPAEK